MSDLSLLKALTDETANAAEPGGRWDAAERAVDSVLVLLYGNVDPSWQQVYEAIKSGYAQPVDWDDE